MTNVDFYILTEPSITACGKYICRLAETAYQHKHRVYIYVDSEKTAHYFNDLLWTFGDISFVPHNIYEDNLQSSILIQIGCITEPEGHIDVLINLTENSSASYMNFKRVLEVIPNDEALKASGRKKYKFYQRHNCNLQIHQ